MKNSQILIVDDNQSVLKTLEYLLAGRVKTCYCLDNPNRIREFLGKYKLDAIILDMNFNAGVNTGNEGLYWLDQILQINPEAIVIMITAFGELNLAVKAIKMGATDFIVKPWDNEKILETLGHAIHLKESRKKISAPGAGSLVGTVEGDQYIVGTSSASQSLMRMVEKVAPTDANILITGESGTGKEMLAREIHASSGRKNKNFVSIDLGNVPEGLFESELFGHKKGAFTDARSNRIGKFELAHEGTLFLDEIGNLSYSQQQKLLAVLQNRVITPVGSNSLIHIDVRLICATNQDLKLAVNEKSFREDLYFRINTIPIELPPLRNRVEDIPQLAYHFLNKYSRKYRRETKDISKAAMEKLIRHKWLGNIRELQHALEKAVILSEGNQLAPEDFSLVELGNHLSMSNFQSLSDMEYSMISLAIQNHQGNISAVAKQLGISRQTLYNKMNKYGL